VVAEQFAFGEEQHVIVDATTTPNAESGALARVSTKGSDGLPTRHPPGVWGQSQIG
jgi:hypothetical protein